MSKYLQEINDQKSKFNDNLNKYENLINKYFPDQKQLGKIIRDTGNLFINNADELVKSKQTMPSAATLTATAAQEFLNIKDEFEPDTLLGAIDNAISNEASEIAVRTNAVNIAINNSSLVTIV